eukprot:5598576-Pyramimonas_sp.AAC.3
MVSGFASQTLKRRRGCGITADHACTAWVDCASLKVVGATINLRKIYEPSEATRTWISKGGAKRDALREQLQPAGHGEHN